MPNQTEDTNKTEVLEQSHAAISGGGLQRNDSFVSDVTPTDYPATERMFTLSEIALRWKVSIDFVRRVFAHVPGVLVFGNKPSRRRYTTIRVPASVLHRVELLHFTSEGQQL